MIDPPPFTYLLVKLASRRNIQCTYCYSFRDETVYEQPPVLNEDTLKALVVRLDEHIQRFRLTRFTVLFHGGEPLLYGKKRFVALLDQLVALEARTTCRFTFGITTNALLFDAEWARFLRIYGVRVTVSLDGTRAINDARRIDFQQQGTYERVIAGIRQLRTQGIAPSVLVVCDPTGDPVALCDHFVNDHGIMQFDVMLPDVNHDEQHERVAAYYWRLFDVWYEEYADRGVIIRFLHAITTGLLGGDAACEAIGYGPVQLATLLPDGALQPLDVLRINGTAQTTTSINIHNHPLQDLATDSSWRAACEASLTLARPCQSCVYAQACGGGYLPHRYAADGAYDHPSAYCDDLQLMFAHIWNRVSKDVLITTRDGETISVHDAMLRTAGAETGSVSDRRCV